MAPQPSSCRSPWGGKGRTPDSLSSDLAAQGKLSRRDKERPPGGYGKSAKSLAAQGVPCMAPGRALGAREPWKLRTRGESPVSTSCGMAPQLVVYRKNAACAWGKPRNDVICMGKRFKALWALPKGATYKSARVSPHSGYPPASIRRVQRRPPLGKRHRNGTGPKRSRISGMERRLFRQAAGGLGRPSLRAPCAAPWRSYSGKSA